MGETFQIAIDGVRPSVVLRRACPYDRLRLVADVQLSRLADRTLSGQMGIDLRRFSHETDVDFSVNVLPFLCCTQFGKQCVELSLMGWRELEPIEKIERFIFREVTAVVELARYCRQVVKPDLDVL